MQHSNMEINMEFNISKALKSNKMGTVLILDHWPSTCILKLASFFTNLFQLITLKTLGKIIYE